MIVFGFHLGDSPFSRKLLSAYIAHLHGNQEVERIILATDVIVQSKSSKLDLHSISIRDLPNINIYDDGVTNPEFEKICFQRFLVLKLIMEKRGIEDALYVDTDLMYSYGAWDSYGLPNSPYVVAPHKGSTFVSRWTLSAVTQFADNIDGYYNHCVASKPRRVCDMNYLEWLVGSFKIKHIPTWPDDGSLQILHFRKFLIMKLPPVISFVQTDYERLSLDGGEELLSVADMGKYYPYDYLDHVFTYDRKVKCWFFHDPTTSKVIYIQFIHLQGAAKQYMLDFVVDRIGC